MVVITCEGRVVSLVLRFKLGTWGGGEGGGNGTGWDRKWVEGGGMNHASLLILVCKTLEQILKKRKIKRHEDKWDKIQCVYQW